MGYDRKDLEKSTEITYPCVMDMQWLLGEVSDFPRVAKLYFVTLLFLICTFTHLELVKGQAVFTTNMIYSGFYFI